VGGLVGFWGFVEIAGGVAIVLMGLLKKEFTPFNLITMIIWGGGKNAHVPRWIAAPFYILLGLLLIYIGLTGK
jgi:hypothetical protein